MSTDTESIQQNAASKTSVSSAPSQVPKSINKLQLQPISHPFEETTAFRSIYGKVKSDVIKILHCHGIPGSGKTQVALNLAEKFLEDNNDDEKVIAWPIACHESNHNVKKSLQELADELQRKHFIKKDVNYSIKDDIKNNRARELMHALFNCNAHVLIIIDDPEKESKKLLQEMCLQLQKICSGQLRICKFHPYLTSRKKDFLLDERIQKSEFYQLEQLVGFSKEEAIEFLKDSGNLPFPFNRADAIKICERFSCLPLGLMPAREYCKKAEIDYKHYLTLIQKNEITLEENEKDVISKKFGPSGQHVFEAIVMPFESKKDSKDYKSELHWRILSCLSYFHAGHMPKFLLERCCYIINSDPNITTADPNPNAKKELDVKSCTGKLISKLVREYGLCSETPEKDIVFHEVVLHAFRIHHQALSMKSKCLSMKKAIEVLCSLVTKNFIKEGNNRKMLKLRPHLQSLLYHAGSIGKTAGLRGNDLLLFNALLSHLYDVTATIMSGESTLVNKDCGKYFKMALGLLWDDKWLDITDICDTTLNFKNCSKDIVELSKSRGKDNLPKDFKLNYTSRLSYCFDELDLESVKSECPDKLKDIERILQEHGSKSKLIIELQKCNLLLQDQLYHDIFYAERFASILHSWSRSILDADPEKVKKDTKNAWRSSLSRRISIQCRLSCSVTLVCERLACRGKISILLEQQSPEYITEAYYLCHELLQDDLKKPTWAKYKNKILKKLKSFFKTSTEDKEKPRMFFENGFRLEIADFSLLSNLRDLVRVHSKFVSGSSSEAKIEDGNNFCEELMYLALKRKGEFANIPSCIVYCAKYYAARENFDMCVNSFQKYFSMSSHHEPIPSFKSYCWAVYNYAKALTSHPCCPPEEMEDAKRKCKAILDDTDNVISKDLNEKIDGVHKTLGRPAL